MTKQRMHINDAKKQLADMEAELKHMYGNDRSGYLAFQINKFKTAIIKFEAQKAND